MKKIAFQSHDGGGIKAYWRDLFLKNFRRNLLLESIS